MKTGTYQWVVFGPPRKSTSQTLGTVYRRRARRAGFENNKRNAIRYTRHWLKQQKPGARGEVYLEHSIRLLYQARWDGKKIIVEEL